MKKDYVKLKGHARAECSCIYFWSDNTYIKLIVPGCGSKSRLSNEKHGYEREEK